PLNDILPAVQADTLSRQAYEKAVDTAKTLADRAKGQDLSSAALAQGFLTTTTGAFEPYGTDTIPGLAASPQVASAIRDRAAELLKDATATAPHPTAVVELSGERKALVIQLRAVAPGRP